jgi:hypothetical protein
VQAPQISKRKERALENQNYLGYTASGSEKDQNRPCGFFLFYGKKKEMSRETS